MEQTIPRSYVARLVLSYLVLGSCWIVFSDGLIPFHGDPQNAATFSLVKGLMFIAVTAAIFALTLSRMPLRMAPSPAPLGPLGWWPPVAILLTVGVAMIVVAYAGTRNARVEVEARIEDRLALEMQLKSKRIEAWLDDHRAISRSIANDPIAADRLQRWLRSGSPEDRTALEHWLAEKRAAHSLSHFAIIDARGRRLLSDGLGGDDDYGGELAAAVSNEQGLMVDLDRDAKERSLHIALITPMSADAGPGKPPLLLVQEIDAERFLLSGIAERSDLSRTGESILVRKQGDTVEFLSELRFPVPGAQPLRLSLTEHPDLPTARVLRGENVATHGIDYRGERVLARGMPVPGTPWALITKIDEDEAFADFERDVRLAGGALVTVWLACLLVALYFWQRHRLQLAASDLQRDRELQTADRRFQELFRCASVGMSICGLDGRLIDVNPYLCAITRRSRESMVGAPMADIIHVDDRPSIAARMAQQLRGEASPTIERRYLRRDGMTIPTLHSSALVRDPNGVPLYFVGVMDDVSALLQSEQALRLSEERFRLAMRASRDGIWDWHVPSGEIYHSPGWLRMLGYDDEARADLGGDADLCRAALHPDDVSRFDAAIADIAAHRSETLDIEVRLRHRDGHYLDVQSRALAEFDDHGQLRRLVGTATDISQRKAVEAGLRERLELQSLLDRIGRMVPGALLTFRRSPQGTYSVPFATPALDALFEVDRLSLRDDASALLARIDPEDLPGAFRACDALAVAEGSSAHYEYRVVRPVGGTVWIEVYSTARHDDDGGTTWYGFLHDISERKNIEARLRERLELLQYVERIGETLPGALVKFRRSAEGRYSIPFATRALEQMFALDRSSLCEDASALFARVHPDDLESTLQACSELPVDGTAGHCEYRVVQPGGNTIWIEAHFSASRSPDGGTTWVGYLHDVSDRRQKDAQLRQAATVFDGTHEGVVIADRHGTIVAVNPAFSAITGYSADEVRGRNMSLLKSGRQDAAFYRDMWQTIGQHGYWQGEIWNRRKDGAVFPEWITISAVCDAEGEVISYVGTFSDITRMKDAEAQLEHQARHDVLTGLPNRRGLRDEIDAAIARARRDGRGGALLMLDLDRFKDVNDGLGHAAGDELLTHAADRLRNAVREVDLLARVGGDEFVVLVEALDDAASAARVAEQLIGAIGRPFLLAGGHEAYVGASVGIANFDGDSESGDLLKHADAALYVAKSEGRGIYRFHNLALTRAAAARVNMESRLRRALEQQQFEVHYQPLVNLADGQVTGVEALLRWTEPGIGPVSPGEFIPLAEENGMIVAIGDWVLRTACRDFMRWRAAGLPLATIAVNLSPRQLLQDDIHLKVAAVLAESGLAPGHLELEITEGTLVRDAREVNDRLRKLKALGVRIAVDDFGTGYSSLVYLRRFPVDKIKIDRAFVGDVPDDSTDAEIVLAVIALGRILNLEVLAEGIERQSQLEFLNRHGCTTGQGFLFSAAVPAERIAGLYWPAKEVAA